MSRIRAEVLRFPRPDGGIDVLDPLLERVTAFSPDEAAHLDDLDAAPPALGAKIAAAFLDEGPLADAIRAQAYAAKGLTRLHAPAAAPPADVWDAASALPSAVAAPWRAGEAWRRLGEARAAGREFVEVPGFLDADAARAIGAIAAAYPYERLSTSLVDADRYGVPGGGPFGDLLTTGPLRALIGAVLGVDLPGRVHVNAWRMRAGDRMGVHPDGRRYLATFSLGLCEGWTARDGGAIAFGVPTADGFDVRGRWLPHAGDLLLFRPHAQSWHAVEVVASGVRQTLTGWYLPETP